MAGRSESMSVLFQPAPEPKPLGRLRILSPHAGIRVSPLQLGAMSIGQAWAGFMGSMNKEDSYKLLDAFVEEGGNFIDTANNYQDEDSETWLGDWMKERKNRDRMVIGTKYTTGYKNHVYGKNGGNNFSGNHKRSLHVSLRDSLAKLQTDWIDILYVHWWDQSTSYEEMMDALDIVVKQGKVLYLGASDMPAWLVSACNVYARQQGKTPFVIYQGQWNCMLRDFEREILPMAKTFGLALAPWDAIGGGRLQSKKALEARRKEGDSIRHQAGGPGAEQSEEEEKYSEVLDQIAQETGVESVTTVALAYLLQKAPYVFPIIGGRKVDHLKQNIQALTINLSDEQIQRIENVKPFDPGFPMKVLGNDPAGPGNKSGLIHLQGWVDYVPAPRAIQPSK